jgi:transposase
MLSRRDLLELLPPGLVVLDWIVAEDAVHVHARSTTSRGDCPECGTSSSSLHSRYSRKLHDFPSHGRRVVIEVVVRRFRCLATGCLRRTFAERLTGAASDRYARRTARSESLLHQIAVALGGRPGARLTARLRMGWSKDTLLRLLRRRAPPDAPPDVLRVVGIDDWAWRRGCRYGTTICDLERRRIVALLPSRDAEAVAQWLAAHPEIRVVTRDRAGGYARAAARGAPEAVQVADRWHLMANASAAFLEAVRRSMAGIRTVLGVGATDRTRLTSAERRQADNARRRERENAAVLKLAREGVSLKEIVRRTGHSRGTVRRVVRGARDEVFRPRTSMLAGREAELEREWAAGCRNGAELWRRLRAGGFEGSLRVVTEWISRRRRDAAAPAARKPPSARTIARLMTIEQRTPDQEALVRKIEQAVPDLAAARDLLAAFHTMIRERAKDALDGWVEQARASLLRSFAVGLTADRAAVYASLVEPWSNGQLEGQITKIKLVKRQMYGRAKLDLLRARLLAPA